MRNRINIEHLKVYQIYDGDIDGLLRNNQKAEIEVYGTEIVHISNITITNVLKFLSKKFVIFLSFIYSYEADR